MPKLKNIFPKYRFHKVSGQGVVTLDGRDHYCGPYGAQDSRSQYDRLIEEWLANGRRSPAAAEDSPLTVNEIIVNFWEHAEKYYRAAEGMVSREVEMYRQAVRPLSRLYGETAAEEFGPRSLKVVRETMVKMGWCRNHVNHQTSRIKSVFKWAVEEELLPGTIHHALLAVKGLKRGRSDAIESIPVRPVSDELVNAVQPFVSSQVWTMIQLQLLTGARAGEIVTLRPMDIDTSGDIWSCQPTHHKTAHYGHRRNIFIGPQAQAFLMPYFLERPVHAFFFRGCFITHRAASRQGFWTESRMRNEAYCNQIRRVPKTKSPSKRHKRRPRGVMKQPLSTTTRVKLR